MAVTNANKLIAGVRSHNVVISFLLKLVLEHLQEAGQEMIKHLQVIMPDSVIEQSLVFASKSIEV
ncbi:hypothetical protein EOJ41_11110 [Vibrio alginolyticus]|nr:hypothetical protein EOJ41_11110 [Vibrio alginolyticus]